MILLVLVFVSNFIFTWVIPTAYICACACAYLASENQAIEFSVLLPSSNKRSPRGIWRETAVLLNVM